MIKKYLLILLLLFVPFIVTHDNANCAGFTTEGLFYDTTTTATAGGTTVLTETSAQIQIFTGASNENVDLPDATTLIGTTTTKRISYWYKAVNSGTGVLTIRDDGGSTLDTLNGGFSAYYILTNNTTTDGVWSIQTKASANGLPIGTANEVAIFDGSGNLSSETNLAILRGGTNLGTTPANGQLLIGNATDYTLATISGTANQVNISNGSGSVTLSTPQDIATGSSPSFTGLTVSGLTASQFVVTNGSSALASQQFIDLTSDVTGALPFANGGTGQTTQTAAFNALDPLTTKGDILTRDATNSIREPVGTNDFVLTADSAQSSGIKWAALPVSGDVVGPGSATDEAFARFDLTTGKLLQNSVVLATDAGVVTGMTALTVDTIIIDGDTINATGSSDNLVLSSGISAEVQIAASRNLKLLNDSNLDMVNGTFTMTAGRMNIENLRFDLNTISSENVNGDIILDPNGSGSVQLPDLTASQFVVTDGTSQLTTQANIDITSDITGVLPIANGGTDSSTALTNNKFIVSFGGKIVESSAKAPGSIIFADSGGLPDADNTRLFYDSSSNEMGVGTNSPDEKLHVSEGVDGLAPLILIENSTLNSDGSLNETAELRFGFGGDNDVARIIAGKISDYDGVASEDDSFLAFFTDNDGTATEKMRIDNLGVVQIPNLTASQFVKTDGSSNLVSAANVDLTADVTGALPIANGGTGQTTQTPAFDALSPTTTKGDIIVNNGTDNIREPVGTNDFVLTADSAQASGVKWAAVAASGGDVVGPGSATDEAFARFDLTTGKLIQNSVVLATDAGVITGVTALTVDTIIIDGDTINSTGSSDNLVLSSGISAEVQIAASRDFRLLSDSNLTMNSGNFTLTAGQMTVENLRFNLNTISSENTNGDIILNPNGSGSVQLPDLTASQFVVTDGTSQLTTQANISLTADVTGALPIANGGTGQITQTPAYDALSPTTTKGDVVVNNGTDNIRIAVGTNTHVLTADSAEASGVKWAVASTAVIAENEIKLRGFTGLGSTATATVRFTTVDINVGSEITLTQDATNGDKVVVQSGGNGIYDITVSFSNSSSGQNISISLNNSDLTSSLPAVAEILQHATKDTGGSTEAGISWSGKLVANDEIHIITNTNATGGNSARWFFTMVKTADL